MALGTLTELTTATTSPTGSISPTGDALVLVACGHRAGAAPDVGNVSSTFSTGGWTEAASVTNSGGSPRWNMKLFWAIAATVPGSGTVSVDGTAETLAVWEITGADATTPLGTPVTGFDNENASVGSPSVTIASPAGDSVAFGVICGAPTTNVTPGTGFTEVTEFFNGTSVETMQGQYDATSPGTTVDWSGMDNGNNDPQAYIGVEILAAGGGPAAPPAGAMMRGLIGA